MKFEDLEKMEQYFESLEKKAPPEFSEADMHKLKREHGTESAFKIAWFAHNKNHKKMEKAADPWAKKGMAGPPKIQPSSPFDAPPPLIEGMPKLKPKGEKLFTAGAPTPPTKPMSFPMPQGDANSTVINPEMAGVKPEAQDLSDMTPVQKITPINPDIQNNKIRDIANKAAFSGGLNSNFEARAKTAEQVNAGLTNPDPRKVASAKASLGGKFGVANLNQITKPKLPMAGLERLKLSQEEFSKMDKFFKKEELSKSEIVKQLKEIVTELKKNQ